MAPNKFENHIKKQLEDREMRPSSDAWLKLSNRLDETAIEQPKRRNYFWYAVAACVVGLIILSAVFFNATPILSETNIQIVEYDKEVFKKADDFPETKTQRNAVEVVSTEGVVEEKLENKVVKTKVEVLEKDALTETLVAMSNEIQVPLKDASEEIINTKLLQVLAQVDALEYDNEELTDAEVDSLLRRAQEEILIDKLFRENHSIDAMALLSEVESELDKSFRDQIFESLKSGFFKVRTAVADRNN